jgi:hypothetical protein
MGAEKTPVLDDGTPLYALQELQRAMGGEFDEATAAVLHAVERSSSAVIQADSAKTVQEEMRHLVRALAASAHAFILAPTKVVKVFDRVLDGFGQRIDVLAKAGVPAPDRITEPLAARLDQVERLTKQATKSFEAFQARVNSSEQALREYTSARSGRRAWKTALFLLGVLVGAALHHIVGIESRADTLLALMQRNAERQVEAHVRGTSPAPEPARRPDGRSR